MRPAAAGEQKKDLPKDHVVASVGAKQRGPEEQDSGRRVYVKVPNTPIFVTVSCGGPPRELACSSVSAACWRVRRAHVHAKRAVLPLPLHR